MTFPAAYPLVARTPKPTMFGLLVGRCHQLQFRILIWGLFAANVIVMTYFTRIPSWTYNNPTMSSWYGRRDREGLEVQEQVEEGTVTTSEGVTTTTAATDVNHLISYASNSTNDTNNGDLLRVNLPDLHHTKLRDTLLDYDSKFNNKYISRSNVYGVHYVGAKGKKTSGSELVCKFKTKHKQMTLNKESSPYKEMGITEYFPEDSGFESLENRFTNCAVVGSSIFMNGMGLGAEIDSHDAVLRFNMAPTEGFENDVGTKTTVRLINSQVLEKKNVDKFETMTGANETLFLWRSGPYNGNLYRWYIENSKDKQRTGVAHFTNYIKWCYRHPQQRPHMINPASLWRSWDLVQEHVTENLPKRVPTSGFTGILIMLALCEKIDIYGYITPNKTSCHYYEMDHPCAPLTWHPVNFEKEIVSRMSEDVPQDPGATEKGLITLAGYPAVTC